MTKTPVKVLLIEDDEDDVFLAKEYLSESEMYHFELDWESRPERAREKMLSSGYDIFLIDYRLGRENGLDLIRYAQENGVLTPSILLTGHGDLRVDLDATRFGAADYLIKTELNGPMLERSIRYTLSQSRIILALNEKERRYRSLFERSIDPIFLADDTFRLIDVNESFLNLFQYGHDDARNLSVRDLFHEEQDFQFFRSKLMKGEQVRDLELPLVTSKGKSIICQFNCTLITESGRSVSSYQGILRDLTLRKKAEKDMLVAERLSMTGKLARTIAHEVRNPLTNLNLALDQLKDEMPSDNESVKLYSDIIERNANRIEQLIGEMLSSSKPRELNLELVDVNELVEDALQLTIDRLNLNQMKLEREFTPDLPRIFVDREKIKIAIVNIVVNATEAMQPERGVLRIATEHKPGMLNLVISDNGKGIPFDDIEKLFDPFFTAKQGGMGLGLTSTKNILDSHSAQIDVSSTVGAGTSFTITFKLAE